MAEKIKPKIKKGVGVKTKTQSKVRPKKTETKKGAKIKEKKSMAPNAIAVIETGGKQYQVAPGETLMIEKIIPSGKKKQWGAGDKITFDKVLFMYDGKEIKIGTPYIDKALVEAEFAEEGKGKKIKILRYRAKSRHRRHVGHRQPYIKIKILSIK